MVRIFSPTKQVYFWMFIQSLVQTDSTFLKIKKKKNHSTLISPSALKAQSLDSYALVKVSSGSLPFTSTV